MTKCLILLLIPFYITGCISDPSTKIINDAIEVHGGKRFDNALIEFDFRSRHYTSHRKGGLFTYTREFSDSSGQIKDVLSNDGFRREINGGLAKISGERASAYSNSVNSVLYFALLPYGLNDPAVIKTYVKETALRNKKYHLIRVTFKQDGGGKDHDDVFLHWVNQQSNVVDYLAYSYLTDGGGLRFREAINPRTVNGILFHDYNNYKPKNKTVTLDELGTLFEQNQLDLLSVINHENIKVELFN